MSMHLITGYAGSEHITSADQGAYNIATYGGGEFVLNRGNKFVTTIVSNNSITVADGEAMMQGRYIKMIPGTSETVTIDNGTSGMKRNDLICLRYEKDSDTGIESASMVVVKGTESSSTPEDPEYTQGTITDGTDLVNEMPLYRVYINGLNIDSVTQLFSVKVSMVDYMDEYQLPSAMNFDGKLGGIKLTSTSRDTGLMASPSKRELILASASRTQRGGIKVSNGLFINGDTLSASLNHGFVNLHPAKDISIPAHSQYWYIFEVDSSSILSMYNRGTLEFIGVYSHISSILAMYTGVYSSSGNTLKIGAYLYNYGDTTYSQAASDFKLPFLYIRLYDGQ